MSDNRNDKLTVGAAMNDFSLGLTPEQRYEHLLAAQSPNSAAKYLESMRDMAAAVEGGVHEPGNDYAVRCLQGRVRPASEHEWERLSRVWEVLREED